MGSQILLYGAQPCDAGRPRDLLQSSGGRVDMILLASVIVHKCNVPSGMGMEKI